MGSFDCRNICRRHSHPLHLPHVRASFRLQESGGPFHTIKSFSYLSVVNFVGDLMIAGAKVFTWSDTNGAMLCC